MVFLLIENFENLERPSVSLLMLNAKQENPIVPFFNVFGMKRLLSGIEPWTARS